MIRVSESVWCVQPPAVHVMRKCNLCLLDFMLRGLQVLWPLQAHSCNLGLAPHTFEVHGQPATLQHSLINVNYQPAQTDTAAGAKGDGSDAKLGPFG